MENGTKTRLAWRVDFNLRGLLNLVRANNGRAMIVSYPRSGRNWLRMMLHELSINPRWRHAGAKKVQCGPETICNDIPDYFGNRILFLLRDPRDTVVSYFHNRVRIKAWRGDLPEFLRNPNTGFERLLVFNLEWLRAQDRFTAFSAVRYEALRQDPEAELARVLRFLHCKPPGSQALSKIIAKQSFDEMKRREISGELHARFGSHFTASSEHDNQRKVRRGVIGGHVDEMAGPEQEFCEELLARYDYNANIARLVAQAGG